MNKIISKYFGLLGGFKFPKPIQSFINRAYVSYFKIDMSEFDEPSEYDSLTSLFTRSLKKPREFDADPAIFISPCDGTCLSYGVSKQARAFSVKGMEYGFRELFMQSMSDDELKLEYDFVNIYLSPRDYHRYHAPCNMQILSAVYIPGKLYSVATSWLKKIDALYTKNERVILKCKMDNGKFIWLVFVGAINVGKMKFNFDERICTNASANFTQIYSYENLHIKKGEELGRFELGSTILIVSEKDCIEYNLFEQKNIKQAESIGMIK
ncbi:phosphatidylserine decarboxylase [Campylobacter mucosalis]|uniref:phosphatidylserine decarboxylase n=1 Tax=Campylobacter mucosalis TaxID=202 RepID=UPI0014706354|nr:phosphatidylserine decarboxylase [Campylobacter mucosalis]